MIFVSSFSASEEEEEGVRFIRKGVLLHLSSLGLVEVVGLLRLLLHLANDK